LKYAVLLATYNGAEYIKEQLESILSQEDVDITLFISDDNSTDTTVNIVKEYQERYQNIILLPVQKRMGSASQNFFRLILDVDFDSYDYISLADQDDIWYPNKLKRASLAINNKKLDGYASNVIAFWENGEQKLIDKSNTEVAWDYMFGSAGPGCTIVLPVQIANKFKQELSKNQTIAQKIDLHDWLIYTYIRSNQLKWWVDSEASMLYRQHDNNEFGANSGLKTFFERWKKARNGWYGKQILSVAEFCNALHLKPVENLTSQGYLGKLKLIRHTFKLRRKKSEAIILALMLIIPGFKI
jgi:rhamnosyltransferase